MRGGFKRRMGESRPKKMTPPHKEPGRNDVRLELGDVVYISGGRYHGWSGHAVVIEIGRWKGANAKAIDGMGTIHEIPKTLPDPLFVDYPPAVHVGHDDEWMRFELGVRKHRSDLARPHAGVGHRLVAEAKAERLRRKEAGEIQGVSEDDCLICAYHNRFGCKLGNDRATCKQFHRKPPQEES